MVQGKMIRIQQYLLSHVKWLLGALLFILFSCEETKNKPTESVQLPTTDSLGFDILGVKLGETYSENRLFDALKSRITDLKPLSEMKMKDWQLGTPSFYRLPDRDDYIVSWDKTVEFSEMTGIPWKNLFMHTTPEGVLYEISFSSSDFNDLRSVDSLFRKTTLQLIESFGEPVYGRMTRPGTKYLSFKTGKIEHTKDVTSPPFSATWYDGIRKLEVYYSGSFDDSVMIPYSLTVRFEDKSIKTAIESKGRETKPAPKGLKSVEQWLKNHILK